MDNTLSKHLLLSILGLAILIVSVVGISCAVFVDSTSVNVVYLQYDEVDSEISLINTLPISDVEGINMNDSSSYFEFNVITNVDKNAVVDYYVLLEKVRNQDNVLNNKDVRIYLEKFVNNQYVAVAGYPNYFVSDFDTDFTSSNNKMILYSGKFNNNSSEIKQFVERFRLKFWVSEDTIIDSYEKVFNAIVKVDYKVNV